MRQVPLTIQGLSSNGYLKAQDEKGEQYELHPDGNRYSKATNHNTTIALCVHNEATNSRQLCFEI